MKKTFIQKFKANPLFWIFSGDLFFLTLNLIFLIALLITLFSLISSLFSDPYKDPTDKVLLINPIGPIVEQVQGSDDPFDSFRGDTPRELYVGDLLEVLEYASSDNRVKNLLLRLDNISGTGQTVLFDVGQALQKFKDSGKTITAIGDNYSSSSYYLASFADEIIINDYGYIDLDGFGRSRLFYKSLLDKLKIDFNVFRVGTFKSAVEPYLGNKMSDEAKEANLAYLKVLWDSWKNIVGSNRKIEPDEIQYFIDNADNIFNDKSSFAEVLLKNNFVDLLMPRPKARNYLIEKFGESEEGNNFRSISGFEYFQLMKSEKEMEYSKNKIAVIVARGTIVNGDQPPGTIGGDSTSRLIREAHENESVKAIVLRVDSGGGGVFASEQIRQEIIAAKEKGLKIIASMGNVAASGGYWISADAHEIWASHNTITGSIGIFGLFPTFDRALNEVGVNSDGVSTSKLNLSGDPTQPLSEGLSRILQNNIEFGYKRFIGLVSETRGMSLEEVDKIAQGRVWAGSTALELGLIDNLGNLKSAINRAAELAGLEDFSTYYPAQEINWREQLLERFFSFLPSYIRDNYILKKSVKVLKDIEKFNDPNGVYFICESC